MSNSCSRTVIFIEWEREFIDFIKGITLSPSLRGNFVVHIFYPQDVSRGILPKYRPWLFKHPAPVNNERKEDTWKILEEYVLKYKYPNPDSTDTTCRTSAGGNKIPNRAVQRHKGQCLGFLLSRSSERVQQLLETVTKTKQGVFLEAINCEPLISNLLDLIEYKCSICKMGFIDKKELSKHEVDFHSLLCYNPECPHGSKSAAFASEKELKQHVSNQLRCTFCPGKVFCSNEILDDHLRKSHKKCPCPCGQYYGDRKTYLDHFFSFYPTPKEITFRIPIQELNLNKKKNASMPSKSQSRQERIACCSNLAAQSETSFSHDGSLSPISDASLTSIQSDETPSQ